MLAHMRMVEPTRCIARAGGLRGGTPKHWLARMQFVHAPSGVARNRQARCSSGPTPTSPRDMMWHLRPHGGRVLRRPGDPDRPTLVDGRELTRASYAEIGALDSLPTPESAC